MTSKTASRDWLHMDLKKHFQNYENPCRWQRLCADINMVVYGTCVATECFRLNIHMKLIEIKSGVVKHHCLLLVILKVVNKLYFMFCTTTEWCLKLFSSCAYFLTGSVIKQWHEKYMMRMHLMLYTRRMPYCDWSHQHFPLYLLFHEFQSCCCWDRH